MTDEQIEDLETELAVGASPRDAALALQLDVPTVLHLMRSDSQRGVRLRSAEARAKITSIKVLRGGDWRAHAHYLKNRYADEWGDRRNISIEAKKLENLTPAELEAHLEGQLSLIRAMPRENNVIELLPEGKTETGDSE